MNKYKLINNITGWVVFTVAAVVYLLTIEPTASFWDCGEFITSAYKLEVGHPPGAPFFMLVGNLFSQLAQDPSQVAMMINSMSALMSAFTILFLFWTITHLTRKLLLSSGSSMLSRGQIIAVIGSGVVGALVYTFSDTFWFSAVEGEVYAFSSMLTALVFWLILKWEDNADKPHSDKWLVLIAYIMGLSVGVHLLNLLCIPAIVLVYYFRKQDNPTWKGGLLSLLLSFGLIIILMWGIIPGFTKVGGWFELFFVNSLGMPYNTGVIAYLIILVATITWGLIESSSERRSDKRAHIALFVTLGLTGILFIGSKPWLWLLLIAIAAYYVFRYQKMSKRFVNLVMSSIMVILVGFSAYALIPIRSSSNTPLDLNSPEDIFSLARYLNREQYGQTPLIYGSTYASQIARDANGSAITSGKTASYNRVLKTSSDQKDRYIKSISSKYKYTHSMLFTRMHSNPMNPSFRNHIIGYERWGSVTDRNNKPTFMQNIRFLVSYQINYMYLRYFMWNFSGRQNDIQGDGGITTGNWITGIPFIDEHLLGLGPQDHVAPDIVNNKGHNKYFMLPLLLGLIGIFYQLRLGEKGFKSFSILFMLFFMTGLAIILYLNQTPFEPRERDYAYSGSFYAFSIWVGMGVAGISLFLRKQIKNTGMAAAIATAASLFVPLQMASQNWDDHDRSGRTLARDTGMNYLCGVGENGIIFTNGDNDTYPLWYVQETEGFRTDVRVTNLSFLQTEWYVDQLLRQAYDSEPLPIGWSPTQYYQLAANLVYIISKQEIEEVLRQNNIPPVSFGSYYDMNAFRDTIPLAETLEKLKTGQKPPLQPFNLDDEQIIPGKVLSLDVDTAKVNWTALASRPSDKMYVDLSDKQGIRLQEMMILELLSNINDNHWERSIHFATTITPSLFMNLKESNFSLNGLTYQVVPGTPLSGGVNTVAAYDNMMNKFRFGGLEENPDIYLDETNRRMISTFRLYFTQLVNALLEEGENEKALALLEKANHVMPSSAVPYGTDGLLFARAYFRLGEKEKAEAIIDEIRERINGNLDWFARLKPLQISNTLSDVIYNNINPSLLITGIYQQYDREKYRVMVDDLLQRAQFFYSQGIGYVGDVILREITDSSVRGYYSSPAGDTITRSAEEETMQKALNMMQQYNPRLLEQYSSKSE